MFAYVKYICDNKKEIVCSSRIKSTYDPKNISATKKYRVVQGKASDGQDKIVEAIIIMVDGKYIAHVFTNYFR